jgi:hypothetical protein
MYFIVWFSCPFDDRMFLSFYPYVEQGSVKLTGRPMFSSFAHLRGPNDDKDHIHMTVDLVPGCWRGLVAAATTAGAYFPAAVLSPE